MEDINSETYDYVKKKQYSGNKYIISHLRIFREGKTQDKIKEQTVEQSGKEERMQKELKRR